MNIFIRNFSAILLSVGTSMTLFAQEQPFTIKGNIKNWPTKYIHLEQRGDYPALDSVLIKNGEFEFRGTIPGPTNSFLVAKSADNNTAVFLFVEPGDIQVNGDFKDISQLQITGSKTYTDYLEVKDFEKKLAVQIKDLDDQINIPTPKLTQEEYDSQMDQLYADRREFAISFVRNHPNSSVSITELYNLVGNLENEEMIDLYNNLSNEIKKSPGGSMIKDMLDQSHRISIGMQAPNFASPDTEGKTINLSDYKGKYVLLDFWASWCAPCRAENPNLVKAYNQYNKKGFEILGVSLDDKEAESMWKQAIKVDKLTWTQVSDLNGVDSEAAQIYGVGQIPTNYLIDPSGKIIGKNLKGDALTQQLKELLK